MYSYVQKIHFSKLKESFDSAIDLKDTNVVFANPSTRNSATTGHNIVP